MALVKTILNSHTVEYDDSEFEFIKANDSNRLHYIGNGVNVTNPKGNTSCYRMFENFKGTSLDLSKFNTSEITNMSFMFANCCNLKSLNLFSFNTHKVTDMSGMFCECINLKTLNISKFNTENVTNMEDMFNTCMNLKHLNLSMFNTNKITDMDNMFYDCINLETLKVGSDYLQFFSINRALLDIGNNVNIIPVTKIDRTIEDLFY